VTNKEKYNSVEESGKEAVTLSIKNRRTCFDCGRPVRDAHAQTCPWCGGSDISDRKARPTKRTGREDPILLPAPWTGLKLEKGATILLSGGAGSGKTTICLKLKPTKYCTSEQEIDKVHEDWWRIVGQHERDPLTPTFTMIYTWEQLQEDVADIEENDILVVDSISQLTTSSRSVDVVRDVVEKVRFEGAIAIFIAQYTKDGDMLGPNMLRHLVDVVAEIPDDGHGMRRLAVYKNRYGSTFSNYFVINDKGVHEASFPYAYSVEGNPGRYSLHMYPLSGSKYSSMYDILVDKGVRINRVASCAIASSLYADGFAEPPDVDERRRFALRHGLLWLDPETFHEICDDIDHAQQILVQNNSDAETP